MDVFSTVNCYPALMEKQIMWGIYNTEHYFTTRWN